ncbi:MAG: hypothetical protein KBT36_06875 [Kurthia sp.]|nr:hypothetical protein [Candidatus Kurthia equi]
MTGQTTFAIYYSRKEILETLGISNNRFYTFLNNGWIREIPNPANSRKSALYYAEDVDRLKNQMELYSKYIMITELVKELKTNKARIKRISQRLKIDYITVHDSIIGKGERILFSQEDANKLRHYYATEETRTVSSKTHFADTSAFFDKELNIALYQPFFSPRTVDQSQRLIKQAGKWGFIEAENNEFIPYEYAMSHLGYFAEYEVNMRKHSISKSSPVSSQLQFELNVLQEEDMQILDILYQISGVNNLRLEAHPLKENHINVYAVKDIVMVEDELLEVLDLPAWQSRLKQGYLEVNHNELFLISPVKRTTVLFELPTHLQITEKAELSNKTVNDFINEAVEHYLKFGPGGVTNENK